MRRRWMQSIAGALTALTLALTGAPSFAQEPYFKNRNMTLFAGFTPGGGIDAEMRLIAQFYGRHIPGAPVITPMNMPGAGGILLGNHLYTIAKPDGLTIGMPGRSGFFLAAAVGDASARYDITKYQWLGSAGANNLIFWVRRERGIRTLDQLKQSTTPIVLGGLVSSSASVVVPMVLAKYEKLPLKVISGYKGLSEATLSMERGEIDAIYTHAGTFRPDRISSGEIVPIFQTFPIEPNLPSLEEIKDPHVKALLDLLTAASRLGAPVLAPPDTPKEMTTILRDAYYAMSISHDYIEESARRGFELGKPTHGAELQTIVQNRLGGAPQAVIDEYKGFVGMK